MDSCSFREERGAAAWGCEEVDKTALEKAWGKGGLPKGIDRRIWNTTKTTQTKKEERERSVSSGGLKAKRSIEIFR